LLCEGIVHCKGVQLGTSIYGLPVTMTENPSKADTPIANPVPPPVPAIKPRLKANSKAQDWRRARIVIAGFAIFAVVGGVLAMVTTYPQASPPATNAMLGGKLNAGRIMSYVGPDKECRQQVFDNVTGEMTKPAPCDMSALEGNGGPDTANGGRRLDSFSKTFSGR
jgi:hypothetical protein